MARETSPKSGELSILGRLAPRKLPWKVGLGLLALACVAAVPVALAAVAPEEPVFTSSANEETPASDWNGADEYIAFAKSRPSNAHAFDAYFGQLDTSTSPPTVVSPVKLNRSGQAFMGGMDLANNRVVFQSIRRGQSNIRFYHPSSGTRSDAGVNTSKWEWRPTVSGNWLLFNRDSLTSPLQQVFLKDLSGTTPLQRLAYTRRDANTTFAGQVNGSYAVWTRCTPRCAVYVRDIAGATTTRLTNPSTTRRYQYAPSVTPDGRVYVARSSSSCGSNVRIFRYDPPITTATIATQVGEIAPGADTFSSFARDNGDGTVSVFYDRVNCGTNRWNVYKITDTP